MLWGQGKDRVLMPLDDREQKILAEIEQQFYEEDPELARAVDRINRPSMTRVRLAVLGVAAGLAVILFSFTDNTILALVGFGILIASATVLAPEIRRRLTPEEEETEDTV
jgi:hypothetical protein